MFMNEIVLHEDEAVAMPNYRLMSTNSNSSSKIKQQTRANAPLSPTPLNPFHQPNNFVVLILFYFIHAAAKQQESTRSLIKREM